MTNPNIIHVRALDCFKSPHNVRTESDEAADAELEANIGATGIVLQNLIGVKVPRQQGKYEIYGGGRRLEAIHRNIANGKLPEDFTVPALILKSAADAVQMSLIENYYHLSMNPADECRAFQAIIEREKKTPAELATRFGLTEKFVLGRLRLAGLAEPVFEALRSGAITLDIAKAYACTADNVRQAAVFEQIEKSYYGQTVNEIRRSLSSGSYKGGDPKAIFVGRDAYEAAGGRIESDLFSDSANEVWRDGDVLDSLAEAKLAEAAEALRQREGFAEVRTVAMAHVPYGSTMMLEQVTGTPVPLTEEARQRKMTIETEIEVIEKEANGGEDYSEEQVQRLEALEEELEQITEPTYSVSDEDRAGAIAFIVLDAEGNAAMHEQLYIEPAAYSDAGGDGDGEPDDDEDGARDDEDNGSCTGATYSQRLRDELAVMKTEILAVHVASDPQFALDLATFIMVDDACSRGYSGMPSELRARTPSPRVSAFESGTAAARSWAELDGALDRTWADHAELHERYGAFCALADEARAAWLGWAVARTLHAVPDGHQGSSFLSHLGAKLGIDVAAWWRPTARNFFDRVSKTAILSLFEAIGGAALKSRYAAARKFDLAASAEKLFAGEVIADAEVKDVAAAWLPAAMQFSCATMTSAMDGAGDAAADDVVAHDGSSAGSAEPMAQAA